MIGDVGVSVGVAAGVSVVLGSVGVVGSVVSGSVAGVVAGGATTVVGVSEITCTGGASFPPEWVRRIGMRITAMRKITAIATRSFLIGFFSITVHQLEELLVILVASILLFTSSSAACGSFSSLIILRRIHTRFNTFSGRRSSSFRVPDCSMSIAG